MSGFWSTASTSSAAPAVVSATPATKQNDYAPSGYSTSAANQILAISPSASLGITGLSALTTNGGVVTILNASTDYLLWLEHESASSSAANRFTLPTGFPAFLLPGDRMEVTYNTSASRFQVSSWPNKGMAMGLEVFDDFTSYTGASGSGAPAGIFTIGAGSSGASTGQGTNGVDTTEKARGIVQLLTGTATTGFAGIGPMTQQSMNMMVPAQGCGLVVGRLLRVTAVSGTETYTLRCGFLDHGSLDPTDGVVWELRWNGSAEEWSQTRFAGGVATRSNTGSPAVDGTYLWTIVFLNANWTRADFIYSTDSSAFTVASSPTTGLPNNTQLTSIGLMLIKSAGTTSRTAAVDLFGWRYDSGARG